MPMTSNKTSLLSIAAVVLAVFALAVSGVAIIGSQQQPVKAGGVTNYDTLASSGFQLGTNCNNGFGICLGTLKSSDNFGTTTLIGTGGSNYYQITASTTKQFDFTCTNVTPADQVVAFFAPTTTQTVTGEGWEVKYAQASTTAGICTATISNDSGVTATIPQGLASTTGYRAQH